MAEELTCFRPPLLREALSRLSPDPLPLKAPDPLLSGKETTCGKSNKHRDREKPVLFFCRRQQWEHRRVSQRIVALKPHRKLRGLSVNHMFSSFMKIGCRPVLPPTRSPSLGANRTSYHTRYTKLSYRCFQKLHRRVTLNYLSTRAVGKVSEDTERYKLCFLDRGGVRSHAERRFWLSEN